MSSNEDDEIVVTGYFPPLRGGGPTGGGGSGGGKDAGQRPPPRWMAMDALTDDEEAEIVVVAKRSRDEIKAAPRYPIHEHVIGICQTDPGAFIASEIVEGTMKRSDGKWPAQAKYQRQCVAQVHNHTLLGTLNPDGSFNADNYERAKRPSEEAGYDRDGMDKIIADGANPLAFRTYIIGPDGIMRKYMYNSPRGVTGPEVP